MYKYVLIAFLASAFVFLGSRLEQRAASSNTHRRVFNRKRAIVVVSYTLSMLVFCIAAGLRSNSVGSDVEFYVIPSFDAALSSNFDFYFSEGEYSAWMPLSKVVFWVVPTLTHSMFWMLFTIQAIIVVPLFVSIRIILKDEAWLAILIFGLVFFPISLNNMRQFMGMGFTAVSYVFVRKRKPLPFLLTIAVSVLFHETCIVLLLTYPLWLISSGELKRLQIKPAILAVVALAVIQIFFPALILVAPYIGGKISLYTNSDYMASLTYNGITELRFIVFLCAVLGFVYCWFIRKKTASTAIKGEVSGLAAIVFFGVSVFSMCLYSYHLFRLGVFFLFFSVFLIPLAAERILDQRDRKEFIIAAICFIALFGQMYFGAGAHEVVPYTIDFSNKF